MEAPDKIYVEIRHPFGNEFTEIVGFENKGNSEDIEYIRKDALIEWAKARKSGLSSGESFVAGERKMLKEIIEKIESL